MSQKPFDADERYIGDAVWVSMCPSGNLKLVVKHQGKPERTIYLEPCVYEALVRYATEHKDNLHE